MASEIRILLVTANPQLRATLGEWLTAAGYHLSLATTGAQGRAQLSANPPHLVLWDVTLPDAALVRTLTDPLAPEKLARALIFDSPAAFDDWAEEEVAGYLVWPAARSECLARLRAWLRCQRRFVVAGQAAREAEPLPPALLRALIESLPHSIFTKDLAGRFTFANQRFCQTQGKTLAEILGKTDFDIHPPELAEKYRLDDARVMTNSEILRLVEAHQPLDGETLYVQVIKAPLYAQGEITGVLGVFWDITQRKHAEAALIHERDLLQTLMDNIPDTIYFKDAEFRFTRVNRAQAQIFGLDNPDDALGKTDFDFFTSEHARAARIDEHAIFTTGQPLIGKVEKIRRADGQFRWVLATKVPIRDSQGQVAGIVGVSRDITERVQAEEALRDINARLEQGILERTEELRLQYARLDAILNNITDGIVVASASGNVLQANPVAKAWLTQGLSPQDALRLRRAIQTLAQETAPRAAGAAPADVPAVLVELTGLDLELRAALVTDSYGDFPQTVVIDIHDVSHLKALERMKTSFIANVSHELRTPVTGIKLYAHLMERHPERWQAYLAPLMRQADHQAELIQRIVMLARLDAGRVDVQPHLTALQQVVDAALSTFRRLAQERGLDLHGQLVSAASPSADIDPAYIQQALYHLLENALDYTQTGSIVVGLDIRIRSGRQWAVITVADTGVGIPEAELPYVFDRFFRGQKSRALQKPGTGLGLAIVKEIVTLHGGDVTAQSVEGQGATFCIWLPLAA